MKIKDYFGSILAYFAFTVFFIIFLPFLLLFLIYKFIMTPFDYAKYKRSRYQKDFPKKYTWLSEPHFDNEPYTAIKENDFPVEYIKWSEEYGFCGYFVYKDILLDFTEPFFFDDEKKLLFYMADTKHPEEDEEGERFTVEEAKGFILGDFSTNVPNRECKKVVFFYQRKNAERDYKKEGLRAMLELDDFIIYEKGELAGAIGEFIRNN